MVDGIPSRIQSSTGSITGGAMIVNKAILIPPVVVILLVVIPSAVAYKYDDNSYSSYQQSNINYNNGYNAVWYQAQTDWNSNTTVPGYWQSGGDPNQGCYGHTQQYCNGYYAGYTKLFGQWQQNQIRINNEQH
jgi:hypothetical protein